MTASENIRDEPFGHLVPDTKLERYWAQSSGLVSLRRRRTLRFDPHACATYAPTEYISEPIQLRSDLPSDEWIRTELSQFVRTEFSERRTRLAAPTFSPPDVQEIEISDSFFDGIVRAIGTEVDEIVTRISSTGEAHTTEQMADHIFQLLCDSRVGSKENEDNVPRAQFIERVAHSIASQERLLLVFLGFPFKDQNRFRVNDAPDRPDVGEVAFLLRLYRATQAIYQLHPFGADILILTDGAIYADTFGITQECVSAYMRSLKAHRTKLNLQGAISFISLGDLVDRASAESTSSSSYAGANGVIQYIKTRLSRLMCEDDTLGPSLNPLISAIKWNHESRKLLGSLSQQDAWEVLTGSCEDVNSPLHHVWASFHETAVSSAVAYAATNLMLRWLNLVDGFFPNSIRCTVHAKPGQICLARANATFPWNGIAWTGEWPNSIDDFEVRPYHTLSQLGPIRKVVIRTLGMPYFYTRAAYGTNINAARGVLPADGWSLDEFHGRPFVADDVQALVEVGVGDENFSWERIPRDDKYYRRLLRFRLDHYDQYGFGVHGLWSGGLLVGQCGLQVLNETRDQVELVIFLGKNHIRKGIGHKITEYILGRCRAEGVRSLYGVARPENGAALGLLRRFNAKPIRTQVHFGYIATVYRIPVGRT